MGYTTKFTGSVSLSRALTIAEARNLLLELEQYYRTIPPSGVIGGV